jgi:molecular chaperone DnaK (HSP70)
MAQHNIDANAETLSSKIKRLFADPVHTRRNADPTRLKEILKETIEENEKMETKPRSDSLISQVTGKGTIEEIETKPRSDSLISKVTSKGTIKEIETKLRSDSWISQVTDKGTIEEIETKPRSDSLISQVVGKEIFTYDSPVFTPGLYNSIWAPQTPAEPDPRDEDFSHLFNYQKKKIFHEIPEWLRKKIEPAASNVPEQTHETLRSYLAELEELMPDPYNIQQEEDAHTMDDADENLWEMGGLGGGMGASKVSEQIDEDLIWWD